MAHVLLIDDDADFTAANRAVLEAHGFQVSTANSAQQGWDLLLQSPPDVVVLDVMMEEFDDGFWLAKDIANRCPRVPILMLTAVRNHMSDKWKFSREADSNWLPATEFLEKPLTPAELVTAIQKALAAAPQSA